MRQPERGRRRVALFPKAKLVTNGPLDWRPLRRVESFLTGGPAFCVVFCPVLFCVLLFPVVCLFVLHLGTQVGLCCSECLPPILSPRRTSDLEVVASVLCVAFLWLPGLLGRGCLKDIAFSRGEGLPPLF